MDKRIIIGTCSLLLLISISFNIYVEMKNKKYEELLSNQIGNDLATYTTSINQLIRTTNDVVEDRELSKTDSEYGWYLVNEIIASMGKLIYIVNELQLAEAVNENSLYYLSTANYYSQFKIETSLGKEEIEKLEQFRDKLINDEKIITNNINGISKNDRFWDVYRQSALKRKDWVKMVVEVNQSLN